MASKEIPISLEEKTRRSLQWSTASNLLSKIIMPITNIILARLLAKDIFGIVASINIIISLAEIFSDSGFSKRLIQTDFKDEKEFSLHKNVSFWTNTFVSILMVAGIAIFRDSLADLVGSPGYGLALAIAAIQIPVYGFSSISTAILRRNFEFKKLFFVRILGVITTLTVSAGLALGGFEHWSLIIGSLMSITAQTILLFVLSKFRVGFVFSFRALKEILSFSIYSFLEAILSWAATSIILVFINVKLGNDISGVYKMSSSTLSGIFNIFSAIFIPVLFSNLSRQKDNEKGFKETFLKYQTSASYIIIPAIIGVILFKVLVVDVFLGSNWKEVEEIIGIHAINTGLMILFRSFPTTYFLAKGKPLKSVLSQCIWLVFYIPISYFAIQQGLTTYMFTSLFLALLLYIITYIFFKASYKISLGKTLLLLCKPILVSIPMIAIATFSILTYSGAYFQIGVIIACIFIYFATFYLCFPNDFKVFINLFFVRKDKDKISAREQSNSREH